MKVPKKRNNLLRLAATLLVATLLTLMNVGARREEAFAAQASPPAAPQAGPSEPSAEALHLLVGRSLVISSQARIFRVSVADPDDRGRAGGESHPNPDERQVARRGFLGDLG